jgi:protein tyrosine/serine phosphatase
MKFLFVLVRPILKNRIFQLGASALAILTLYVGSFYLSDNYHEVIPDKLYRSGQLEPGELTEVVQKYGIKSVLNLRGDNTGTDWYDNEVAEAKAANVKHLNFRMSAKRGLTYGQTTELIAVMRNAPKPLLIHCQGGADRSGLASALYMSAINQSEESEADSQLSLVYGHFPSFGTDKMCMTLHSVKPLISERKS